MDDEATVNFMFFKWTDYTYKDDELVDSWLDEDAVSLTGLEDGWRAFYDYWANELKYGYWCKTVHCGNDPIAIIFFDYNTEIDSYHISEFVVRPEYRGKGYGTKIINELLNCSEDIFGQRIEQSNAVIFKGNVASRKAFMNAGFILDGTDEDGSTEYYYRGAKSVE